MKQLKVALEWSNKGTAGKCLFLFLFEVRSLKKNLLASVDDKGIARTSHCIPHRFATENLLLKRCKYCAKIITDFRGYRCIRTAFQFGFSLFVVIFKLFHLTSDCSDCFHTKCGKYAPPNCGLSGMKDALSSIQLNTGG